VLSLRRGFIVRFVICALLAWTAVDLFVPQLCEAEAYSTSAAAPDAGNQETRGDDCFCCSHVVSPMQFETGYSVQAVGRPEEDRSPSLVEGIPRSLFHPPLSI
jgi:hypothetical protein